MDSKERFKSRFSRTKEQPAEKSERIANGIAFAAKYAGHCGFCGEPFEVGRMVIYNDDVLVTLDCNSDGGEAISDVERLTPKQVAELRSKMCRLCFCVHAGECV